MTAHARPRVITGAHKTIPASIDHFHAQVTLSIGARKSLPLTTLWPVDPVVPKHEGVTPLGGNSASACGRTNILAVASNASLSNPTMNVGHRTRHLTAVVVTPILGVVPFPPLSCIPTIVVAGFTSSSRAPARS
ncbi:hypothetical protein [Ferrimicrobium sp.]|uniref:hypothetical protein n=1 Tax=Ferrimicrobium sp. TaxID=2926050 RepID=UPI002614EEE3|nr:hypothetical protein [Ferrimicrobium sp.]